MTRPTFLRVVAAVAAAKGVEHLVVWGWRPWLVIGLPLLLGAALSLRRPQLGMAVIAGGALLANLTPAYRNHLVLLLWLAATLALFRDPGQERLALRCTLTIMYGFATLAKLWPDWLSGTSLAAWSWVGELVPVMLVVVASWLTILVEAALAVAVWLRSRWWFALAVLTHLSFLAFLQPEPWELFRLAAFGTLSLATWLRATEPGSAALARRRATTSTQ